MPKMQVHAQPELNVQPKDLLQTKTWGDAVQIRPSLKVVVLTAQQVVLPLQ